MGTKPVLISYMNKNYQDNITRTCCDEEDNCDEGQSYADKRTKLSHPSAENDNKDSETTEEESHIIDVPNNTGNTPLHEACSKGQFGVAQILLKELGADPLAQNNDGDTALHLAIRQGHRDVSELLCMHMENKSNKNKMVLDLGSLLGLAAEGKDKSSEEQEESEPPPLGMYT